MEEMLRYILGDKYDLYHLSPSILDKLAEIKCMLEDNTNELSYGNKFSNYPRLLEHRSESLKLIGNILRVNETEESVIIEDRTNILDFDKFIDMCNKEILVDDDGFGEYSDWEYRTSIKIYPSDVKRGIYLKNYNFIYWNSNY